MLEFSSKPENIIQTNHKDIHVFKSTEVNIDPKTVNSFSNEWKKFSNFDVEEIKLIGNEYFDIINETVLNKNSYVLDLGCGMGRWSYYLASKVKFIEAIDPSDSVFSAAQMLKNVENIRISKTGVDNIPFGDKSFDFAFSLGVLHHIPDTSHALKKLVEKVKIGGNVLIYLYYNLDNRGLLYKFTFYLSNILRLFISKLPFYLKLFISNLIAFFIYLPFVGLAKITKLAFRNNFYKKMLLSYYLNKAFKVMRNDALDRFGTPLEQRFSRNQIIEMMENAGLGSIIVSPNAPFWHATGTRLV